MDDTDKEREQGGEEAGRKIDITCEFHIFKRDKVEVYG